MTTIRRGRPLLQTPGPTNIPDRILRAMHRAAVDFNAPDFVQLARSCFADLKPVFRTDGVVFIYAASGHGAWEAALANTLSPGDRILVPETGNFSVNWGRMAASLGVEIETLPGDWRHAVDPQAVEARLREDRDRTFKAVLLVQTDTATGITSDVGAIRAAIDRADHPALYMVDTIASLACAEFRMDDWRVDVAVGASQKGLMCPPGLSFTAASPRAMKVGRESTMPRNYWDWRERLTEEQYVKFCGTAPEHLLFALREALDMLAEEGLGAAIARHRRMADAVHAAVGAWTRPDGVRFNALVPEQRSVSVTTLLVPDGVDGETVRCFSRDRFDVALGGGLARLAGKAFRIGHMGDLNAPMVIGALGAVEATLQCLQIPLAGSGVAAATASLAGSLAA
jgi:alanine-glyoxylate transaminase/serine-glyoxylate transaminase/serine-pyruvate transaminase